MSRRMADLHLAGWQIYISVDYDLHHGVLRFNIKSCTARRYSEVRRINVWSPSSLSVLISVVADPTVLWNPWLVPFPQQASRSELFPSQVQLFSQLDLFNVRFPQVEFRAEKPVVTFVIFSEIREVTGPELTEIESKFYQYASCKPGRI